MDVSKGLFSVLSLISSIYGRRLGCANLATKVHFTAFFSEEEEALWTIRKIKKCFSDCSEKIKNNPEKRDRN